MSVSISIELTSPFDDYTSEEMGTAYAAAVYDRIDQVYGQHAETIKKNAKLIENKIEVDGFLASALLTGKDAYDLKEMLTSSSRTRDKNGRKLLAVPVKNEVRTITSDSPGWKHPGFSKDYWEAFKEMVNKIDISEILSTT